MDDGQLSFGAVIKAALFSPKRLFEAVREGRVNPQPFWLFLVGAGCWGVRAGLEIALVTNYSAWFSPDLSSEYTVSVGACVLIGLLGGLLLSPLFWLFEVVLVAWLGRMLGSRANWQASRAAVGLGAAPRLLGLLPLVSVLAELAVVIYRGIGVKVLHGLSSWRSALVVVVVALVPSVLAMSLRAYVLESFKMPSGSMFPSMEVSDHFFADKTRYGWGTRPLPKRGEVVVFRYPGEDMEADLVKRVVGLPGDELSFVKGVPHINGWQVPSCALGRAHARFTVEDPEVELDVLVEYLEGHAYLVALEPVHETGNQGPYLVEPGELWVLGDNRNNSSDSRSWREGKGAGVPLENLKGRARWLWLPGKRQGHDLGDLPRLPEQLAALQPALDRCLAQAPGLAESSPPPPRRQ